VIFFTVCNKCSVSQLMVEVRHWNACVPLPLGWREYILDLSGISLDLNHAPVYVLCNSELVIFV
jgi:hypothetical protein